MSRTERSGDFIGHHIVPTLEINLLPDDLSRLLVKTSYVQFCFGLAAKTNRTFFIQNTDQLNLMMKMHLIQSYYCNVKYDIFLP